MSSKTKNLQKERKELSIKSNNAMENISNEESNNNKNKNPSTNIRARKIIEDNSPNNNNNKNKNKKLKQNKKEIEDPKINNENEVEEEEKEEKRIEIIVPLKFDFHRARKIVKLCLSKDNLYGKFLDYVLSFNKEQFENLFQGNEDYKKYPYLDPIKKVEFNYLLMRFEDYNSLLFEWYKDESKYDNIVKLWNSKLCISKLKDESDAQINERLKYLNISDVDNFISDFKDLVNNSIESKSSDIKNY